MVKSKAWRFVFTGYITRYCIFGQSPFKTKLSRILSKGRYTRDTGIENMTLRFSTTCRYTAREPHHCHTPVHINAHMLLKKEDIGSMKVYAAKLSPKKP